MDFLKQLLRAAKKLIRQQRANRKRMFKKEHKVRVVKIVNTLKDRSVSFENDGKTKFVVKPGETIKGVKDLNPPLLFSEGEINSQTISRFQVEGDANPCSYAIVSRVGIISALGVEPKDYNIHDPAYTHLSWEKISNGQNIILKVKTDEQDVVWVIGDLDDNI